MKIDSRLESVFEEPEIAVVDQLLVEKLLEGSITRKMVNEELYLPIIIFISEVYRITHGGELIKGEQGRLTPSSFRGSNGIETSWYLTAYMDFQESSFFLTEVGCLDFIYAELVAGCAE